MDIGFLLADTEYVIALDVDAFPVSDAWAARLITPLKAGAAVSGVRAKGGFVHPCALAMRRERFVRAGHTFRVLRNDAAGPGAWWDTGELITIREQPNVHIIPPTHHIGPYWVGTTWDDTIYHNFYAVRHKRAYGDAQDRVLDPVDGVEASGVTAADARRAWSRAIEQYLDLDDAGVELLISGTTPDHSGRSGGHAEPASGG
jgi:hypothetical protein